MAIRMSLRNRGYKDATKYLLYTKYSVYKIFYGLKLDDNTTAHFLSKS